MESLWNSRRRSSSGGHTSVGHTRCLRTQTPLRVIFLTVAPFLALAAVLSPVAGSDLDGQIATMDALWAQRANPERVHELIRIGTESLAQDGDNYAITWRVGLAYWWMGHTGKDGAARAAACSEGMRYGEAAVHRAPDAIEGRFVYALTLGEYGASIGVVQAVMEGIGQRYERAALDAYALDPDYDNGTTIIGLGRYYYLLPWPLRNLNKSRRYLEEARDRHPRALWGRVYLAQTYYELGQQRAARAELRAVLSLDPMPGKQPEDTPAKAAAMEQLAAWYGGADN
jgi:tetratricopeptide (TPR) repeat protein